MMQPTSLNRSDWPKLQELARIAGAELGDPALGDLRMRDVAAVDLAGPMHLTFFDNKRYADQVARTQAGACLVSPELESSVPQHVAVLRVADPYLAFVSVARHLHADSLRPASAFDQRGVSPSAVIHPTAWLEDGVTIDPLAVVGPNAEIGAGTVIGPNVVVGPSVTIGRDCSIGAGSSILSAMLGNNVIVHPGCRIGQDGYGFIPGAKGHIKVPQMARVILQNNVEIGAGSTIDRGALRDTVVGEGTKIDNLVQIGHNVVIGRHCIIVSQSGIAGSSTLGDGVVLGARVGVSDHATIGAGAQLAARSSVVGEVPPGEKWAGSPAKPARLWAREIFTLRQLALQGGVRAATGRGKSKKEGE